MGTKASSFRFSTSGRPKAFTIDGHAWKSYCAEETSLARQRHHVRENMHGNTLFALCVSHLFGHAFAGDLRDASQALLAPRATVSDGHGTIAGAIVPRSLATGSMKCSCNRRGTSRLEKRVQDCGDPNCKSHCREGCVFPEDTVGSEGTWDTTPDGHEHNMYRAGGVRDNEKFSVNPLLVLPLRPVLTRG